MYSLLERHLAHTKVMNNIIIELWGGKLVFENKFYNIAAHYSKQTKVQ